jgi:hypothetical protein
MDKKEFNIALNEISDKLKPLNQLLYQALILISFYYFFYNIKKIELHKSFIVLFAVVCTILDLCIWNNINQTILFGSILMIYITFNTNKIKSMDNFINIMNNIKDQNNDNIKELWKKEEIERQNKNEIEKITFVPKNINDNKNAKAKNNINLPDPYDKQNSDINEINLAYKSPTPNLRLTDAKYAIVMLNDLYDTPQYKNITKDSIDNALNNDIHFPKENTTDSTIYNTTDNTTDNKIINKNNNIELFRKPKIQFLDTKWLTKNDNTYNDNCKTNKCIDTHMDTTHKDIIRRDIIRKDTNRKDSISKDTNCRESTNKDTTRNYANKNAICSVSNFGKILSECTNQNNTISESQLDKISSNDISHDILD